MYATIEAVERFVDRHYAEQITRLRAHPELRLLRQVLVECQTDAVTHRDEAAAARCVACGRPMSWRKRWARTWDDVKFCCDACRKAPRVGDVA